MSADNRPPRDITPAGFFCDWLPRQFAREFGDGRRRAADTTVAVRLEGEGGGTFVLDVIDGVLRVRGADQIGPEPQVTMVQPVADWRAVAVGESGAIDLAPPQASPLDVLFVDPASREILRRVRGTVRFEVTGYHGRTWWMLVRFGTYRPGDPVDAVISTEAETYARILSRQLAPPEAYLSGLVQLRGDTGLAMELTMAILPRFTR